MVGSVSTEKYGSFACARRASAALVLAICISDSNALPGAFTPTCSSSHVPRYNELADEFKRRGVNTIACVSVNDAFVMDEWCKAQEADKVLFLPDGNGEFSEKMGMLVDKANLGFGKRSWRYSMLVDDGVIKKMFIEPEVAGDPFDVSDADTMLKYLDPSSKAPHDVLLFTKPGWATAPRRSSSSTRGRSLTRRWRPRRAACAR